MFKKVLFLLLLITFGCSPLFSQIYLKNPLNPSTPWKKGYVIFKGSHDTLEGYVSIQMTNIGDIRQVWYCTDTMKNENGFWITASRKNKDTLRFFGFEERKFKYFNYTDKTSPKSIKRKIHLITWVEIIEFGPISISFGFSTKDLDDPSRLINITTDFPDNVYLSNPDKYVPDTYIPMYCLKKRDFPTIIIVGTSSSNFDKDFAKDKLHDDYKQHFISYLSDDTELVEKIRTKELLFSDIEVYVKEYNKRVKAKQN